MIVLLSPQFLEKELVCPETKQRVEFRDREVPGLYIEVRSGSPGTGTAYLAYKSNGVSRHQRIGSVPAFGLAELRKRARTLKSEIMLGADPRREAKARNEVPTFERFIEEFYLPHKKPRKRSYKRDEELYRLRLKKEFGSLRLNQITRQQVQLFHTRLLNEGLAAASCDLHVRLARHALNLAVEWNFIEKNPLAGIKLFNVPNAVEHYMNDEELERLLSVLRTDKNRTVCLIAMWLLSTGARCGEALTATHSQIDKANRVWRISASNSKSKRVRSVPLNDSALDVLSQLDTEGHFDHLFINKKTGKPYVTIFKVWTKLRKKAGLPHLRIHDLRHQYASFLVNSNISLYSLQNILGHSDPKVTMRYAHLSTKALQDAANCASVIIKGAMQTSTPAAGAVGAVAGTNPVVDGA